MIKICLGITSTGTIKAKTTLSLIETAKRHDLFSVLQYGNCIDNNREKIIELAIKNLCSHLFFVDSDMSFPGDTLERLLEQDKDVIGAPYNYRFLPLTTTVKFLGENKELVKKEMPKETFEVYAVGMGCTLIKMSILEKLNKPYFLIKRSMADIEFTEDVYFCEKAREAGFSIWCDPKIKVEHWGDYPY